MNNTASMQILNGKWKLAVDPENEGRKHGWFGEIRSGALDAPVPGVIQQIFPGYHGVAWYWHSFRIKCFTSLEDRILIRFGAVDYLADVWVNGEYAGSYEGGETPFEFDITDSVKLDGDNLLAVRVLNPTNDFIDGYTLVQTPHRNKVMTPQAGCSFNSGGIIYPVELRSVPPLYISSVYVRPDINTGGIALFINVLNTRNKAATGKLSYGAATADTGEPVTKVEIIDTDFPAGVSQYEFKLTISQPRYWNLDDPFLYRVYTSSIVPDARSYQQSVRFGFREFKVIDGYFHLNGRRILLKSTHTGNHMPVGMVLPVVPDHVRRDIINAKACGFNAIRTIGAAYPEQLDFCDEIGMMVIEESYAGWLLGAPDSGYSYVGQYPRYDYVKKIEERYDHNYEDMICRDRNHACIVAWQLLNETEDGRIFEHACQFLSRLRELDTTRLVLLNSGRFDGRFSIGTVSNPGSNVWEHVWGVEGAEARNKGSRLVHPSQDGAGDFHIYPTVPHSDETISYIRNLGRDSKPVFLSEYGIGSLLDVINEWRHYEMIHAGSDLEDASWLQEQGEKLYADWKRLGFNEVYPFPEDMLRESHRLNARQRTLGFNIVRSNPKLCGYNVTGMLDHGMCGEGLWTFWRKWKPEMFDAICDGWSPLRWCLFAGPMHTYSGRDITVEAVLANEDALSSGNYPVSFKVFGPTGTVWQKSTIVKIPEQRSFAVPVIRETFKLEGPTGQYTFAANLERGGAPTGGSLKFYATNPSDWSMLQGSIALWGIDSKAEQWLKAYGAECSRFEKDYSQKNGVILVGKPEDIENDTKWELLKKCIYEGATVIFLSSKLFKSSKAAMDWLPLKGKGRCETVVDHLYHKECVANRHPVFEGLQGPGIMDMDYYGQVIPHEVFLDQDTPDVTICAGFNTGYICIPRGYGSNLLIALHRSGKGRFILNTPYILENLDMNPAADRLMLNLIRFSTNKDQ